MNGGEKMVALVIGSLFGLFVVFSIGGDIIGYVSGNKPGNLPVQSTSPRDDLSIQSESPRQEGLMWSPRGDDDYNGGVRKKNRGNRSRGKRSRGNRSRGKRSRGKRSR